MTTVIGNWSLPRTYSLLGARSGSLTLPSSPFCSPLYSCLNIFPMGPLLSGFLYLERALSLTKVIGNEHESILLSLMKALQMIAIFIAYPWLTVK